MGDIVEQIEETTDGLLYGEGSTSIFDPVLCELAYRWFCPSGGLILDPFAGGSVRGVVANKLGRSYRGVELRQVQVEANERQRAVICDGTSLVPDVPADNMPDYTPVEYHEEADIWMKREDHYTFAGVRGAKVRTCMFLVDEARKKGVGVITAGGRHSPQVNFVAQIAYKMGVKCRVHVPTGPLTPELLAARSTGAKVVQHEFGYNTVIFARAREDAEERGWVMVPYGMESQEAIDFTIPQTSNLPAEAKRLVNCAGSGMTLAGILWGLENDNNDIPVLAVCCGGDPTPNLDKWAPENWRDRVELEQSPSDYNQPARESVYAGVQLDPFYEAKTIPFLKQGDCLWVSAIRPSAVMAPAPDPEWILGDAMDIETLCAGTKADFLFTCPPYGDLEVYSDDPADLSNMSYADFIDSFGKIMERSYRLMKDNSFACVVVGDFRSEDGFYRGFPMDAVAACEDAGWRLYNEAILVTRANSLPLRTGRQFDAARKLGKTHQQVVVFVKGDWKKATWNCGPVVSVDISEVNDEIEESVDE